GPSTVCAGGAAGRLRAGTGRSCPRELRRAAPRGAAARRPPEPHPSSGAHGHRRAAVARRPGGARTRQPAVSTLAGAEDRARPDPGGRRLAGSRGGRARRRPRADHLGRARVRPRDIGRGPRCQRRRPPRGAAPWLVRRLGAAGPGASASAADACARGAGRPAGPRPPLRRCRAGGVLGGSRRAAPGERAPRGRPGAPRRGEPGRGGARLRGLLQPARRRAGGRPHPADDRPGVRAAAASSHGGPAAHDRAAEPGGCADL
ncbi:MAG: Transcriptional regulator, partial [uncultured Blastococcus sp.]